PSHRGDPGFIGHTHGHISDLFDVQKGIVRTCLSRKRLLSAFVSFPEQFPSPAHRLLTTICVTAHHSTSVWVLKAQPSNRMGGGLPPFFSSTTAPRSECEPVVRLCRR